MKSLKELVRPNIWDLKPYSSARNEYHGAASVFLDANENPYNAPFNRYPDPVQSRLKLRISEVKGIDPDSIFVGNGSDEPIDLIIRAFCDPAIDCIVSIAPSYGMYEVAANVNDVECRKVLLDENFDLNADRVLEAADEWVKVIFLCSPNNPTGNSLSRSEIYKVLNTFEGIVVLDEAYIDFSDEPSFLQELAQFPNLIILQTLSKAWGGAGLRLGMAFASPEIVHILTKIKYPYNVSELVQEKAMELLKDYDRMQRDVHEILLERNRLEKVLKEAPYLYKLYPSDANFILADVGKADAVYEKLVRQGVVVRNRNSVTMCRGCLRITVGTPEENNQLLEALKNMPR